ncbi:hypothetical protein AOLI_G00297310 [Acnodon oligacanthus]
MVLRLDPFCHGPAQEALTATQFHPGQPSCGWDDHGLLWIHHLHHFSSHYCYFYFWPKGCAIEGFMATLGGEVALWSLVRLAIERYIVVCKPMETSNSSHAMAGIAFTWVMAHSCAAPPLVEWPRCSNIVTIKLVILMVVGFLVAWTPYANVATWIFLNKGAAFTAQVMAIPAFFSKSSIIFNPIIYVLLNKQWKEYQPWVSRTQLVDLQK